MIIDFTRLNNNIDKYIELDSDLSFDESYFSGTDLLDIKNVHIKGRIFKNSLNNYQMNVNIKGIMILPCAVTLKPVERNLDFDVDEELEEFLKNDENIQNSLDILPIIWENILMEIPTKVLSEEASSIKLEGDGWKLITDEERNEINPEFEKLKDLL